MGLLLGSWDEHAGILKITKPNGQKITVKNPSITAGSFRVFGVETVGKEIHVLTGPRSNRQPSRRVKFSESGLYKGSTGL